MAVNFIRLQILLGFMLLIIIGGTLITYSAGRGVIAGNAEIVRRQEAVQSLSDTLYTLVDAETGERGYLITGNKAYLEPYNEAVARIQKDLGDLGREVDEGTLDRHQVAEVTRIARQRLAELDRTIAVRTDSGLDAAVEAVRTGRGKAVMDELRRITGEAIAHQRVVLEELQTKSARATILRTSIFIVCGGMEGLFCIWAYLRILAEMRRHAAASLEVRKQKDLLSVTLGSIGDAVMVCDLEARLTFMNPMAETLTGWPMAQAQGKPLSEIFKIINEESRQTVESPVEKVFRLGQIVGLANHTLLIRRDGTEVPIDDSGAPIRDDAGKIYGVVLVFRDFSEHKEAEKRMLAAKGEAENANRAKDQFLATLSHELRTPLTPVVATLNMWDAGGEVPAALKADIQMMRRNIELEARLIDDLLDLTRITKGKLSLNMEPVNLHDLLTSVVGMVRQDAAARNIRILLNLGSRRHFLQGDSARMQQIMWNLLKNAIKFTPEGGRIDIESADEGQGRISFRVKDTGIGIAAESFPRLFRPFEQAHEAPGKNYGGLGLGLAISKALVDAQGGTISAQSDGLGKGAVFTVTFPAIDEPAAAARKPAEKPAPMRAGKQARILLVEDHADSAHALARIVAHLGHHVQIAGTAAEAMQLFEGQPFDLLMSDLGLPDASGLELVRQIQARRRVPAIALTGFGMEEDVSRSREAGFDAHLTKPINFQKLEAVLFKLLQEQPLR